MWTRVFFGRGRIRWGDAAQPLITADRPQQRLRLFINLGSYMNRIFFIALSAIILTGCSSYPSFRDKNRSNIIQIERGMTRPQVMQIMGTNSVSGIDGTITNPYKRELIRDHNGIEYEVLYYYTEKVGNKSREQGMTPVILRDGRVVGIGWRYLGSPESHSKEGETTISIPRVSGNPRKQPTIVPNAYGPGVHMNQYGQAVTLTPESGGVQGEHLEINPNAYGPGIHMDQYGRPVREKRWP